MTGVDHPVYPGALVPPRFSGTVSSVHQGIVNIDVGGYFVSLVADTQDRTALAIYAPKRDRGGKTRSGLEKPALVTDVLALQPGDSVVGTPEGIRIASGRHTANRRLLRYGSTEQGGKTDRYSGRLTLTPEESRAILDRSCLTELARHIVKPDMIRGIAPVLVPPDPDEEPYVTRARRSLRENPVHLIGLGPGFTPAGDDFIAGALLAEALLAEALPANAPPTEARQKGACTLDRAAIAAATRSTTTGGATIIRLALAGCAPAFVHDVFAILSREGPAHGKCKEAVDLASRFGHSSGIDLLTGFLRQLGVDRVSA